MQGELSWSEKSDPTNRSTFMFRYISSSVLVLIVMACLYVISPAHNSFASTSKPPRIVVIDSYHHGYGWSAQELDGLLSRLKEVYPMADLSVEHLDAKRKPDEDSINLMKDLLKEKYAGEKIDVVVALDNPALELLLSHRKVLFKDVPLVFGGINDFDFKMLEGHSNVTGVAEVRDLGQTVQTALKLHPETRKILVLHDYTSTGLAMRRELEKLAPTFSDRVMITFSNPMTYQEAIDEMRSMSPDSIALILTFITDRHGKTSSVDQSTKALTSAATRPVYSPQFNALGHGVVGGAVFDGKDHGRRVADQALKILAGEKADRIPVDVTAVSKHIFDYVQLDRFGIRPEAVPDDSVVMNRPQSFYEQHKTLTMSAATGALILITLLIILLISLIKFKRSLSELEVTRNSLSVSLRELEIRNRLNTILLSFTDQSMFDEVLKFLLNVMDCQYGIFGYFNEDGAFVVPAITAEAFPGKICDPGESLIFDRCCFLGVWSQALKEKGTLVRNTGPFSTPVGHAHIENTMVSPIFFNDVVVSSIQLANKKGGFSSKDESLLETFCAQIGPVLFARLERDKQDNERRKAEAELARSERFLEQIVENIPDMIFIKDVEDLRFVLFNRAGEELLGYDRQQLLGKNDYDLFTKEQADFFTSKDRAVIADKNISEIPYEEIMTKNKGLRILHTKKLPVLDCNGSPQFLLGISTDVTDQKIAEDGLKSAYFRLHQIFESITGLVLVIDSETYEILYANKFSEDMYGKKLEGEICYQALANLGLPCKHCAMSKVIELAGLPLQKDYFNPILHKHLLITERIIKWPDGRNVKFQFALDMTDFRQSERDRNKLQSQLLQAQKMEAVGTLAGGIAHDFNNLLQVVLGYSEMILDRKKTDDMDYQDVEKIFQAGKRGADLVRSLLTFSRRVETTLVTVDLNNQITSLGSLLSRTIPKNIHIDLRLGANPDYIKADPSQIDQVLMNLAVNARDAMPNGGTLTIETANVKLDENYCKRNLEASPGEYVSVIFSDTGLGMEQETLEHIFEPFFSTKEVGKGTGLGLATVYGIVKQLGGHISCESQPNRGATFSIFLPAVPIQQLLEPEQTELIPVGGKETILLVDDEEEIRNLGAEVLGRYGYKILMGANGKDALNIYKNKMDSVALVILDLMMPEMDGIECFYELLSLNPSVRILIASGLSIDVNIRHILEKSVMGFVEKPFDSKKFASAVRTALDKH